jgi:hypothetical protein
MSPILPRLAHATRVHRAGAIPPGGRPDEVGQALATEMHTLDETKRKNTA